jgi:hypothetical protein
MILKANLKLRKVGNKYMLVDVSEHDTNITSVHTFNESAAFVWCTAAEHGLDAAVLASMLCEEYDVDYDTAFADVHRLLHTWQQSGLIL